MAKLLVDNDQSVSVENLRLGTDNSPVNNAIVTAELLDDAGGTVLDSDIALVYEPGSDGNYSGLLPSSIALTAGSLYTLRVVATTPGGLRYDCRQDFIAQNRACFSRC